MTRIYLDPSSEYEAAKRPRAAAVGALPGKTVGLLDISKARGDVFLDRVEEVLSSRGITVKRYRKPTFAKPAPADLRAEIRANCDAVIEALAD